MVAKYSEWNQCVVVWAEADGVAGEPGWLGCAALGVGGARSGLGTGAARGSRTPARARTALAPPDTGVRRAARPAPCVPNALNISTPLKLFLQ